MLIEQVVKRCFDKQIYAVHRRIFEDVIPIAILGLGPPEAVALIAGDGSCVVVEHGVLSDDFGTIDLSRKDNLLATIAGAPHIFDMSFGKGFHTTMGDFPMMLSLNGEPTLLSLNPAAKNALGFDEHIELNDIWHHCRAYARDISSLIKDIMDVSDGLDNPLFLPKDVEVFDAAHVKQVTPILRDILTLQDGLEPGDYTLRAAWPKERIKASLRDEDEDDLPEICLDILRKLTDFDGIYRGVSYERIGRGGTRLADFDQQGAVVVVVEVERVPSRHDRLSAWQRLEVALSSAGVAADEVLTRLSKKQ